MARTFVGFGFGPIQSALFLFEAYQTGKFARLVVAEIDAKLVEDIRANSGAYAINIARPTGIDSVTVHGVELFDPNCATDREHLLEAIVQSDEMATALPSVAFYDRGTATSAARILAEGLACRSGRPGILYAAENHNHAAEILGESICRYGRIPATFQLLNTVVGKMSGVISGLADIKRLGLAPMTPTTPKAILVEEFNRILVTQVRVPYRRLVAAFREKPDLLPFEEAKLYGHNAIHALIGYVSHLKGLRTVSEASGCREIMEIAHGAFLEESGRALCRKYAGLGEHLFTEAGYRDYAEDLLCRMVNPHLNDLVERVVRDSERKLGYDDRVFGTMRLALRQGIEPTRMAVGAAAGVQYLAQRRGREIASREQLGQDLRELWAAQSDAMIEKVIDLTWSAHCELPDLVSRGCTGPPS